MEDFFDALDGEPIRVEGWLRICEQRVRSVPEASGTVGSRVPITWRPGYVVVRQDEQSLTSYKSEQASERSGRFLRRLRLDGGRAAFHRHWGLRDDSDYASPADLFRLQATSDEASSDSLSILAEEVEEGSVHCPSVPATPHRRPHPAAQRLHSFATLHVPPTHRRPPQRRDTSYDVESGVRGRTDGTLPNPSRSATESLDRRAWAARPPQRLLQHSDIGPSLTTTASSPSTPHRLASFLSRPFRNNPLKRTKSVSKLDPTKRLQQDGPVRSPLSAVNGDGAGSSAVGSHPGGWGRRADEASLRAARSHESLLNYSTHATHAIDLGSGQVRSPLSAVNGDGAGSSAVGSHPGGWGRRADEASLRAARSHESLLNYSTHATHAIDLGSGQVRSPLSAVNGDGAGSSAVGSHPGGWGRRADEASLRAARSHESLLNYSTHATHAIDLGSGQVRSPLSAVNGDGAGSSAVGSHPGGWGRRADEASLRAARSHESLLNYSTHATHAIDLGSGQVRSPLSAVNGDGAGSSAVGSHPGGWGRRADEASLRAARSHESLLNYSTHATHAIDLGSGQVRSPLSAVNGDGAGSSAVGSHPGGWGRRADEASLRAARSHESLLNYSTHATHAIDLGSGQVRSPLSAVNGDGACSSAVGSHPGGWGRRADEASLRAARSHESLLNYSTHATHAIDLGSGQVRSPLSAVNGDGAGSSAVGSHPGGWGRRADEASLRAARSHESLLNYSTHATHAIDLGSGQVRSPLSAVNGDGAGSSAVGSHPGVWGRRADEASLRAARSHESLLNYSTHATHAIDLGSGQVRSPLSAVNGDGAGSSAVGSHPGGWGRRADEASLRAARSHESLLNYSTHATHAIDLGSGQVRSPLSAVNGDGAGSSAVGSHPGGWGRRADEASLRAARSHESLLNYSTHATHAIDLGSGQVRSPLSAVNGDGAGSSAVGSHPGGWGRRADEASLRAARSHESLLNYSTHATHAIDLGSGQVRSPLSAVNGDGAGSSAVGSHPGGWGRRADEASLRAARSHESLLNYSTHATHAIDLGSGQVRSPLSAVNGDGAGSSAVGSHPGGWGRRADEASLRAARSHESLLNYSTHATHAIDLGSGQVDVKMLHPSVLNQPNCIQVQTKEGATKYFHCRSPAERDRWVQSVRRTMEPGLERQRRTENWLQLWVLEAKGVAAKRKFFVELTLDNVLYARTSAKPKTDICFWGEHFEFQSLPAVRSLCLNLYREPDKKKKKDRATLVGYVEIPLAQLASRHPVEKWYVVTGQDGKAAKGQGPAAVRVKGKWASVPVLPLPAYGPFLRLLQDSYLPLSLALEPALSVKAKEDFASSLVRVLQKRGLAKDFLCDLVMAEVDALDNEHLMFRGNSLATKAMEAYMKLVGDSYLHETLGEFVRLVLSSEDDCEVDPLKLPSGHLQHLQRHQKYLTFYVEMAWGKLVNSFASLPVELRLVFAELRSRLREKGRGELADNVISSSLFLRFLCPAVLSPSLFGLVAEFPSGKGARNLTLIAKTLQTLANFSKFGGKEHYMEFMNAFVDKEWNNMREYLRRISSPLPASPREVRWQGSIDVGLHLSLLHAYLQEAWLSLAPKPQADFTALRQELDQIADALEDPSHPLNFASATSSPAVRGAPTRPPLMSPLSDYENNNAGYGQLATPSPRGRAAQAAQARTAQSLQTADEYVTVDALADNLALRNSAQFVQERRHRGRPAKVSAHDAVLGQLPDNFAFADDSSAASTLHHRASQHRDPPPPPPHNGNWPASPSHGDGASPSSSGQRRGSQLSIVGPSSGYNSLNHSSHSSSSASSSPVDRAKPSPAQQPLSIANPLYSLPAAPIKRSAAQSLPDIQAAALSLAQLEGPRDGGRTLPSSASHQAASPDSSLDSEDGAGEWNLCSTSFSSASAQTSADSAHPPSSTPSSAPRTNPRYQAVRSPRLAPANSAGSAAVLRSQAKESSKSSPKASPRPLSSGAALSAEAIIAEQQRKIALLESSNHALQSTNHALQSQLVTLQKSFAFSSHNVSLSESSFESAPSSPPHLLPAAL